MEILKEHFLTRQQKVIVVVLIILYAVGIIGFSLNIYPEFKKLTPVNLFISLCLVLYNHPKWNWAIILFCILCSIIGFTVEMKGVETGQIFGVYHYGDTLGYKYNNTPLSISVNWLLIAYCSGSLISYATDDNTHWILKALLAAAVMVSLDVLIEPIAMSTDMWSWANNTIPTQNYIGWFITAFVIQVLFFILNKSVKNKVAVILLIIQFAFFWLLSFKFKV